MHNFVGVSSVYWLICKMHFHYIVQCALENIAMKGLNYPVSCDSQGYLHIDGVALLFASNCLLYPAFGSPPTHLPFHSFLACPPPIDALFDFSAIEENYLINLGHSNSF